MRYSGFPVDASLVSAQALLDRVLPEYPLMRPLTCSFLQRGVNDTFTVQAGSSTYYLRVYRCGWRKKSAIEAEVDILNYLARNKQPVSHPVRKKSGAYLTRIAAPEGTRYAALFTEAAGGPPDYNAANCRQYGEIVAGMHSSMDRRREDSRRFEIGLTHLIDEPLGHLKRFLGHRQDDVVYLRDIGARLKSRIDGLLPKQIPEYGCCHGDHHGFNVHQDEVGKMVVFDFDCYGYGWRAYDVAVFLWRTSAQNGFSRTGKARTTRHWNAFLDGYSKIRSLTANELEATKVFVPIRQIWLLGLHSQLADTLGNGFIQDTYLDRNIGLIRQWIEQFRLD